MQQDMPTPTISCALLQHKMDPQQHVGIPTGCRFLAWISPNAADPRYPHKNEATHPAESSAPLWSNRDPSLSNEDWRATCLQDCHSKIRYRWHGRRPPPRSATSNNFLSRGHHNGLRRVHPKPPWTVKRLIPRFQQSAERSKLSGGKCRPQIKTAQIKLTPQSEKQHTQ